MKMRSVFLSVIIVSSVTICIPALAQEDATPEIRPVKGSETTEDEVPTLEELAAIVRQMRQENTLLRREITDLEAQIRRLEAGIAAPRALADPDSLEQWHRRQHQSGALQIRDERTLDSWHLRDHQRRNNMLIPRSSGRN